jgi:cytochrome bd-type quinol oxidase subunit 1
VPRQAPEHYVRPPLVPREPPPAWIAVWRFRLLALALLALLVLLALLLYRQLSGANDQDPGLEAAGSAASAAALLGGRPA